jgi:enoyl-CoA hydratase
VLSPDEEASVLVEWPNPATAVLRLSGPDRLNALTHEMLDELTAGLREAAASDQARAVVLTGAGRAFCAGVDIAGSAERGKSERSPASRYVRQEHFADTIRSVRGCRLPVIAAVNRPVAGAGMALALTSDIRPSSRNGHRAGAADEPGAADGCARVAGHRLNARPDRH